MATEVKIPPLGESISSGVLSKWLVKDGDIVKAGQPVQLNFFRQDPNGCLSKVLIPEFDISSDLPLNQTTTIELTPSKTGEYSFTCGMNMFRGVLEVQV